MIMTKRFLVMIGYDYYSCGADDIIGLCDSPEEAKELAFKNQNGDKEWYSIVDLTDLSFKTERFKYEY